MNDNVLGMIRHFPTGSRGTEGRKEKDSGGGREETGQESYC